MMHVYAARAGFLIKVTEKEICLKGRVGLYLGRQSRYRDQG